MNSSASPFELPFERELIEPERVYTLAALSVRDAQDRVQELGDSSGKTGSIWDVGG